MSEIQSLRTRGELADAVGRFCQDLNNSRRAIIVDALDLAYLQAIESFTWPQLIRWIELSFTIAGGGNGFIHLPKYVRRIVGISDTTSGFNLQEWSGRPVIDFTHGLTNFLGEGTDVTHVGNYGINTILTAGTVLRALSEAADTRKVWMRGMRLADQQSAQITLNGTTPVPFQVGNPATNAAWDEVYQVTVTRGTAAENANVVTIEKTDGTDVGFIERNDTDSLFKRYRVHAIPSQASNIRLVYLEDPPTMFDDTQVYPLPITRYLVEFAQQKFYETRGMMDRAVHHARLADSALLRAMLDSGARRTVQASPLRRSGNRWRGGFGL